MSAKLSIEEVWTFQAFETLEGTWNELLQQNDISHLYCTYEMAFAWWKYRKDSHHLGGNIDRKPAVFLIKDGGKIIGIVPLVFSYDKLFIFRARKVSFSIGRYWQADFVIERGRREECVRFLMRYILEKKHCYSFELEGIEADSETLRIIKSAAEEMRFTFLSTLLSKGYYLPIKGTWEEFVNGKSKEFGRHTRHALNRLSKLGRLETLRVGPSTPFPEIMEGVMEVERGSWKKKWVTEQDGGGFVLEVLRRSHKKGWLDLTFLQLNDVPIAFQFCVRYEDIALALHTSYSEKFAEYSAGFLCFYFVVKQFFDDAEKVREIDFGSDAEWMGRLSNLERRRLKVQIYRRKTLVSLARLLLHTKRRIQR